MESLISSCYVWISKCITLNYHQTAFMEIQHRVIFTRWNNLQAQFSHSAEHIFTTLNLTMNQLSVLTFYWLLGSKGSLEKWHNEFWLGDTRHGKMKDVYSSIFKYRLREKRRYRKEWSQQTEKAKSRAVGITAAPKLIW